MPGIITISNPQTRVKDTYAPAPKIDLTVRANGEEEVLVMNSLAQWMRAGIESPTLPPSVTAIGTAGTFTANKYWQYSYVYVAKQLYPHVENAVTGGGSPAPRSNPSPIAQADSIANTNAKRLDIPTTQRSDISHIWIYRSALFDTSQQSIDFATGGNMFWIGEIINNPNLATVPFTDTGAAKGLEQIENDNFLSPQFSLVIYADPFFWGFGNSILEVNVTVTPTGVISLVDVGDKWYSGRNGQIVTFDGITSGGFDNHGSFYFKAIDNTTAQLYQDISLTTPIGLSVTGSSFAHIRGPATVLYRSKPRNPFSWGETDLVGDIQIPLLYTFSVGGGNGTAIAVIPNLNLLKLDTESPNKCYTLNLKNAGTPNFESSLRNIADNYCVSNHHSQFSAILDRGQNVLWGIDSKGFAVVECDSSSQQPISSVVYKTMRGLSVNPDDRKLFHGCYCPRAELNCLFVRSNETEDTSFNKAIFAHGPTGLWGTIDVLDVLCSAQVFDRFSGQMKMFVGTEAGLIGEAFAKDQVSNWFTPDISTNGMQRGWGLLFADANFNEMHINDNDWGNLISQSTGLVFNGLIGNWVTIINEFVNVGFPKEIWRCRIASVNAGGTVATFDKQLKLGNDGIWRNNSYRSFDPNGLTVFHYYIGLIEMVVGKTFDAGVPFEAKKIEEIYSTWLIDNYGDRTEPVTLEYFSGYARKTYGFKEQPLILMTGGTYTSDSLQREVDQPFNFTSKLQSPLGLNRQFGLVFRNRAYGNAQLMNYELRLNDIDGNNN